MNISPSRACGKCGKAEGFSKSLWESALFADFHWPAPTDYFIPLDEVNVTIQAIRVVMISDYVLLALLWTAYCGVHNTLISISVTSWLRTVLARL
jgi:hypothetical protein